MDKVNVLIIEDIPAESDALSKVLFANNYNLIGIARTYNEALNLFYKNNVDVIIIDVFLNNNPEGIAFAETINVVPGASKPFVFLTSSNDRQIFERAKLTRPFSFLMKPFNELEILYAVELAVEKFHNQNNVFLSEEENTVISEEYLFVKKGKSLKKVLISDIIYIEVEERYCSVVTEQEKFIIQISLVKILKYLDDNLFSRTHRNFIINTNKIKEVILADNLILLEGNNKVVLSDSYKDFINQFQILR